MEPNRQTTAYLQQRFRETGIRPDPRRGQNFLVDLNLLDVLIREADVQPDEVVLEIGTGTGSLSVQLAQRAAAVVTVELDPQMHQLASQELVQRENVVMLCQDALRNKNNLHPRILEVVREQMAARAAAGYKLVANLPYNIATPVISNLLLGDMVPKEMTVTIQKELAERITAQPGTKDYSALSVWVQSLCDTQLLRVLPPSVFWPRPKVSSAFLHIVPRPEKRARLADLAFYHRFVRALFFHRRKLLRSVLVSAAKDQLDKAEVDQVLSRLGLDGDCRAEQLEVARIQQLVEAFRQRMAGGPGGVADGEMGPM